MFVIHNQNAPFRREFHPGEVAGRSGFNLALGMETSQLPRVLMP